MQSGRQGLALTVDPLALGLTFAYISAHGTHPHLPVGQHVTLMKCYAAGESSRYCQASGQAACQHRRVRLQQARGLVRDRPGLRRADPVQHRGRRRRPLRSGLQRLGGAREVATGQQRLGLRIMTRDSLASLGCWCLHPLLRLVADHPYSHSVASKEQWYFALSTSATAVSGVEAVPLSSWVKSARTAARSLTCADSPA